MKININDIEATIKGDRLIDLFKENHLQEQKGLAIAVNQEVVPQKDWNAHRLQNNDSILVIQPIHGG